MTSSTRLGESWVLVVAVIYSVTELFIQLPLFILEKRHHEGIDGFEIIAHDPNAKEISKNVKNILEKKDKEIQVFRPLMKKSYPEKISYIDESEFEKECAANFKRYFETAADENPLKIPWGKAEESERITDIMYEWCKETNERTKGLVLHSFSILKLAIRHGFTVERLRDDLKIKDFREVLINVVYNPDERSLLLLRKAESENPAAELALAFDDLKLFILLFHDVLSNSGMKVIPLVVTDKKVGAYNLDCPSCKNHVLSEEDFTNIKTFRDWWLNRSIYFENRGKGNITEALRELSEKFLSKVTGVLSAASLYPNYIPEFTPEKSSDQHMEHLKVLLTPEQMDVYYSQEKHMVIKGGFGCGKSIIAAAMLQKISESLKEDEKLYCVCYDPRSELLNQMVKDNQEKVIPFPNKAGMKLSEIIEHITKGEGPGKINFIVDEYDGEDLNESEAQKINNCIYESLKEAFFVLIVQPITKGRVIKKIRQNKNKFDTLKKTVKVYDLSWNMRNSIEIHKLIEATKKVLSGVETVFIHPDDKKTGDQLISRKESVEEDPITNKFLSAQEDPHELEFEVQREQSEESSGNFKIELDEAHAIIGLPMADNTDGNITVSSFSYAKVEKTGHQINTQKPVLFELGDMEEFKKHLSLIVIFKQILNICSKHVVLHFDTDPNAIPSTLRFAFEHYSKIAKEITTKYQEFDSSKESVLVCSYRMFRGLEHPIITILIDRDIYFQQHYLVEMLARCTSKLYVVVLQNSEALTKVTDEWKDKILVNHCETEITEKPQRKSIDLNLLEYPNIIRATYKSEKYKELEKAFKLHTSENEAIAPNTELIAKGVIDSITR